MAAYAVSASLGLAACSQHSTGAYTTFTSERDGYKLTYPRSWLKRTDVPGLSLALFAERGQRGGGLSASVGEAIGGVTLDQLGDRQIDKTLHANAGATLQSRAAATLGGRPAGRATVEIPPSSGHDPALSDMRWVVAGGQTYVVSFTAPSDLFASLAPAMDRVFASFALIGGK